MRRRSRTRRVLKWVGVIVCLVIASAFFVTIRWRLFWVAPAEHIVLSVQAGAVVVGWKTGTAPVFVTRGPPGPGWSIQREDGSFSRGAWFKRGVNFPYEFVLVPMWAPFLVIALATVILWHRDRRPTRGHCQRCGYNLTGNVTGVCPECGIPK